MNATFKWDTGGLLKALEELPQRVAKRIQGQALFRAAEPLRDRMAKLAPHAPGAPDLRDQFVISRARGEDRQETAVAIGPTPKGYYGSFQEFGTSRHGAQPFARPAFDETTDEVLETLAEEMWDAINFGNFRGSGPL